MNMESDDYLKSGLACNECLKWAIEFFSEITFGKKETFQDPLNQC